MKVFRIESNNKRLFSILFENAKKNGLPENDINNAKMFYNNRELELALDTITQQSYEYNLKVDEEFIQIVNLIIEDLKLEPSTYSYIVELLS